MGYGVFHIPELDIAVGDRMLEATATFDAKVTADKRVSVHIEELKKPSGKQLRSQQTMAPASKAEKSEIPTPRSRARMQTVFK